MKKHIMRVAAICLAGAMLPLSSCIGSFKLSHKLLAWNQTIGNKFVNELVFIAFWILPVYEVSGLADILVLNTVEFWSGTNPVAKSTKVIKGSDGQLYKVRCHNGGYDITNPDGTVTRLCFDADHREWSTETAGQKVVFLTYLDEKHVKLPNADGTYGVYSLDHDGLYAYRTQATTLPLMASR